MDILNHAFEMEIPQIFQVDGASGGWSMYGGPLWVRPKQLEEYGLRLNQIVGHTPQKKLTEIEIEHGYKFWLTDYIEYNEESEIVPFILEI